RGREGNVGLGAVVERALGGLDVTGQRLGPLDRPGQGRVGVLVRGDLAGRQVVQLHAVAWAAEDLTGRVRIEREGGRTTSLVLAHPEPAGLVVDDDQLI